MQIQGHPRFATSYSPLSPLYSGKIHTITQSQVNYTVNNSTNSYLYLTAPPSPLLQSTISLQGLPSYSPGPTTSSLPEQQYPGRCSTPETPRPAHGSSNLYCFYGPAPPTPSRHPGTSADPDSVMSSPFLAPSELQTSLSVSWGIMYANNPYAPAPPTPYWIPMPDSDGFMLDDDSIIVLGSPDESNNDQLPSPPMSLGGKTPTPATPPRYY